MKTKGNGVTKYEVACLMHKEEFVSDRLKEAQEQGWEICGDILIKNSTGWCGDNYFHIPIRRKIK